MEKFKNEDIWERIWENHPNKQEILEILEEE